jgi:RNA polymerase sigma-70 factor, ECF subfamily
MAILIFTPSSNARSPTVSFNVKRRAIPIDADPPADANLVLKTLAGHRPAFDELIRRYQRQAVAVSHRLLGNVHDALEVTQDAFLKAYLNLASLQKPEAFGGWLLRIVSNLSLNSRRGRKSRRPLPLDDLLESTDTGISSDHLNPAHRLASAEMGGRLRRALRELPDKQRAAVILFTIERLPQKQVAQTLGCSIEAVKWHVFQARKKLKEILKNYL